MTNLCIFSRPPFHSLLPLHAALGRAESVAQRPVRLAHDDRRRRLGHPPFAAVAESSSARRKQKVPQAVRHGEEGIVVHPMQMEEGVQPFRRLKKGPQIVGIGPGQSGGDLLETR